MKRLDKLLGGLIFLVIAFLLGSFFKQKNSYVQLKEMQSELAKKNDLVNEKEAGTKFTLKCNTYIWRDTMKEMSYTILKQGEEIIVPNYKENYVGYYLITYLGFPNYIHSNDLNCDNRKSFNKNLDLYPQEVIKMTSENGVYTMPCEVNGLRLKFIFDTGAGDVSISLTEANFMLKNDYLSKDDLKDSEYYQTANGELVEGTIIILREIKIGNRILNDVKASVVHTQNAPLLLGQSALSKIGKFSFDYSNNTLILGGEDVKKSNYQNTEYKDNYNENRPYTTTLKMNGKLRSGDSPISDVIAYISTGATVSVIENKGEYWKVFYEGKTGYLNEMYLNVSYNMTLMKK
jgi:clan AA aspartic protease (TIGR02281 family)